MSENFTEVVEEGCRALNVLSRARAGQCLTLEPSTSSTKPSMNNVHRATHESFSDIMARWGLHITRFHNQSLAALLQSKDALAPDLSMAVRP